MILRKDLEAKEPIKYRMILFIINDFLKAVMAARLGAKVVRKVKILKKTKVHDRRLYWRFLIVEVELEIVLEIHVSSVAYIEPIEIVLEIQ
jgi:hypothetical protein